MAEIDKAPLCYRAVIEFWWWLEKRNTNQCINYMHRHDDADPPEWMQNIGSWLSWRRKHAEWRALDYIEGVPK